MGRPPERRPRPRRRIPRARVHTRASGLRFVRCPQRAFPAVRSASSCALGSRHRLDDQRADACMDEPRRPSRRRTRQPRRDRTGRRSRRGARSAPRSCCARTGRDARSPSRRRRRRRRRSGRRRGSLHPRARPGIRHRPSARGSSAPGGRPAASAGAPATMRSPMIVCRRMNDHSSASRGPGLERIASGMPTLPTSCSSAACAHRRQLVVGHVQPACDELGHPRHVGVVRAEIGVSLRQRPDEHGLALVAGRPSSAVLALVHALVGDSQRVLGLASGSSSTTGRASCRSRTPRRAR